MLLKADHFYSNRDDFAEMRSSAGMGKHYGIFKGTRLWCRVITCATEGLGKVQEICPKQHGVRRQEHFKDASIATSTRMHQHDRHIQAESNSIHPIPERCPMLPPIHLHGRDLIQGQSSRMPVCALIKAAQEWPRFAVW